MSIQKQLDREKRKAFNLTLKQWQGSSTQIDAIILLGQCLALAYSAAYDPERLYGTELTRWNVTYKKNRGYTIGLGGNLWASMTVYRAFELANNPAHLMIRSGALETGMHQYRRRKHDTVDYRSVLDKRIYLLNWINPRDVRDLENAAVDEYLTMKANNARALTMKVKRPEFGKNLNKMLINSGHSAFDSQTTCLGTGNYMAPTLHGEWIRPHQEVVCSYRFNAPGHLQEFDLGFFKDINTPGRILDLVRSQAQDKPVQFYALFHFYQPVGREFKRVVHGYVLTDENDQLIQQWNTGPTWKSWLVLDEALPYLAVMEEPNE